MSVQVKAGGAWSADVGYADVLRKASGTWTVGEEMLRKVSGVWQQVWRKDGPPPDPTSVSASSANGGINTVTWAWPSNPEADYNNAHIEQSVSGGAWGSSQTKTHPNTGAVFSIGITNGISYKYRVRFSDGGGNYSAWVESATITGKNLPPATPTISVGPGDWSAGNFSVNVGNIVSAYSDVSNVTLRRRPIGGGGWSIVSSTSYVGASYAMVTAHINYDTYHEYYLSVTSPGGTTNSAIAAVWSRPAAGAVKSVAASSSHTYSISNGAWRTDSYSVRQGRFDGVHGLQQGGWFNGTAIADECHGHAPASAQLFLIRDGSSGFSGTLDIFSHGYISKPASGGLAVFSSWASSYNFTGADASAWETIPSGLMGSLASGAVRGFGLYTGSTLSSKYRVMRGPDTNGYAGVVQMTF